MFISLCYDDFFIIFLTLAPVNIRSRIIPTLVLVKIPPRIIPTLALVKIHSYEKNQYIFFLFFFILISVNKLTKIEFSKKRKLYFFYVLCFYFYFFRTKLHTCMHKPVRSELNWPMYSTHAIIIAKEREMKNLPVQEAKSETLACFGSLGFSSLL